eukprot:gene11489-12092_t
MFERGSRSAPDPPPVRRGCACWLDPLALVSVAVRRDRSLHTLSLLSPCQLCDIASRLPINA